MAADFQNDRGSQFYLTMALLAVTSVFVGFSTAYLGPMASGQFEGPVVAHIHGGLFFAWIALIMS